MNNRIIDFIYHDEDISMALICEAIYSVVNPDVKEEPHAA